jgi:hypothetical protein
LCVGVFVLRHCILTANKIKTNTFNPSFSLLRPPSGIAVHAGFEFDAPETQILQQTYDTKKTSCFPCAFAQLFMLVSNFMLTRPKSCEARVDPFKGG